MNNRRVVVTGIGVVSSVGIGKDAFWNSVVNGVCGISEVSAFDTSGFTCHRGGEVKIFLPGEFMPKHKIKFLSRTSQLAIAASALALKDAGVPIEKISGDKLGVIIGTTLGETYIEDLAAAWIRGGLKTYSAGNFFRHR